MFSGGTFPCYLAISMYHSIQVGFFVPWLLVVPFFFCSLAGQYGPSCILCPCVFAGVLVLMMTAVPWGASVLPEALAMMHDVPVVCVLRDIER